MLSQLVPPVVTAELTVMVIGLALEVVMLTVPVVVLLVAANRLMGFAEALRILLPPPPPGLPLPLKVTVMVFAARPVGEVGVRVTVAAAPLFTPDVELPLRPKFRFAGVTLPLGETTSQFPEFVVSFP